MLKDSLAASRQYTDLLGNSITHRVAPTRAEIKRHLKVIFRDITLEQLARLLTNDFQASSEYFALRDNGRSEKTCQRMSLLFNPHRLDTRTSSSKLSIYQALKTDSYLDGLARVFLARHSTVKENLLYMMLQWGVEGIGYANEFPPHVARDIYREFRLDKNSRILDPCGGWGGRMIGASVVSDHYDCYEPATRTAMGLKRLASHLAKLTGSFAGRVAVRPFEDSKLRHGYYDFALTSPPYYDTEIYTDEETNSLNRYKTFQDWTSGFYLPLIDRTLAALKPGAVFVINIGDRKYPLPSLLLAHCRSAGVNITKLPTRLAKGGGLRNKGEGEVFFILRRFGGE